MDHHTPGGVTGLIAMTPAPTSPQPSFFGGGHEDSTELQIIHADNSASGNGHANGTSQMSMMVDRVPIMKPLTFQQEFPQHYKDHRNRDEQSRDGDSSHGGGRRGSVASYASEEYERGRSQAPPARHTPSHNSPGPHRTASQSPVMHRSPYQTPTIAHQASPQVPPTFASIMHAYPAPPIPVASASAGAGDTSPYGSASTNGGSRSR